MEEECTGRRKPRVKLGSVDFYVPCKSQSGHHRNRWWWYELRVRVIVFTSLSAYYWVTVSITSRKRGEREYIPFPFCLRHLLPQSCAVQGLEKLECTEQVFRYAAQGSIRPVRHTGTSGELTSCKHHNYQILDRPGHKSARNYKRVVRHSPPQ